MRKKDISFEPLIFLLFSIVGTFSIITGLVLIISKLFGYPYLFKGVVELSLGLIFVFISKLYNAFLDAIDTFTNTLNAANKKNIENNNKRFYNPDIFLKKITDSKSSIKGGDDIIRINSQMTPEQIINLKNEHPYLSGLIDSMFNMAKTNFDTAKSTQEKDAINLKELNIEELKIQLQQAIDKENFEQAALIKNEIENRE